MSASDRIPTDDQVRGRYSDGAIWQGAETETSDQHLEDFDAWLARVKRDAAREAVIRLRDHLARARGYDLVGPEGLDYYIHNHHPEEAP